MLHGRTAALERVRRAIDAARQGEPSLLLVTGEAGIGKTALVEAALDDAAGVTILRVRGREAEAPIPYAGLHALLLPLLGRLDELPRPQADALGGAFALRSPEPAADRFGVGAATLTLLGAVAAEAPVVVVVDDGHWLDEASWSALRFTVGRLVAERVTVVVTWRSEVPLGRDLLTVERLGRLDLGPLPPEVVKDVVGPRRTTPAVAGALHRATGGNPLALRELARLLDDEQLDGRAPLPDPLPVGHDVAAAFGRRVAELPDAVRRAVLVLAAGAPLTAGELLTATRALRLRDDALAPAEAAELVVHRQGRLELAHPLLRSTAYWGAPPADRREAHAALAGAVADPARATWHRAQAAAGPNEAIAAALEASAADARARGAFGSAARALERAAELSPDPTTAARRLVDAGQAALHAGSVDQARMLLGRAGDLVGEPGGPTAGVRLQASIELWSGQAGEARDLLDRAAARVAEADPAGAATLLAESILPTLAAGDVPGAAATARRARALVPSGDAAAARHVALMSLTARICAGEPADAVVATIEEHLGDVDPAAAGWLGLPLLWLERFDRARFVLHRALDVARAVNAPALAPMVLTNLAELEVRTANLVAAHAHASQAVELAASTGRSSEAVLGHVAAAKVAALRGDRPAVAAHVDAAMARVGPADLGSVETSLHAVRGLAALGAGDLDAAVAHLDAAGRLATAHGLAHSGVVPWRGDLVEALLRAERRAEAVAHLEVLEEEARATQHRAAAAAAARGRLLLAGAEGEGADDLDLAVHAAERAMAGVLDQPLARARTLLVAGEQLRRRRRRREARHLLREAAEVFARVGARPWRERAERELEATGARRALAPTVEASLDALTPQELQVALAVAEGGTNREVAAALFLSPKTVESHLGRAYRKLAVRSRSELTALVHRLLDGEAARRTTGAGGEGGEGGDAVA